MKFVKEISLENFMKINWEPKLIITILISQPDNGYSAKLAILTSEAVIGKKPVKSKKHAVIFGKITQIFDEQFSEKL